MDRIRVNEKQARENARLCRSRGIVIPTFAQLRDPRLVPAELVDRLKLVGLWDLHPLNLFRITWKNDASTGAFGTVNHMEIPQELTGVRCRIIGLVGKFFPTGAHKVGATFGCLVPRVVTGDFDPAYQKAVWPSTGNYCRGGAYNSALLGCKAIAILPQEMSRERFEWLESTGAEVIATPGCESNVKEIYDKCKELVRTRNDVVVFNQFEEFGNSMWHYTVTGPAVEDVLQAELREGQGLSAFVASSGSAGTLGAGDYLKTRFPGCRVAVGEALQCPTLLMNGFGAHRIEGIGDKHVPWIHNVRNTDVVVGVDDASVMALMRLFNEPEGKAYLQDVGVPDRVVSRLDLLGLSGIGNLLACIKVAKWFEFDDRDVLITVFTDSMELYGSRLQEARRELGPYDRRTADRDFQVHVLGQHADWVLELDYRTRKRIHNLKYYTWVEQQGKDVMELNAQWYDRDYWPQRLAVADEYDKVIEWFNSLS